MKRSWVQRLSLLVAAGLVSPLVGCDSSAPPAPDEELVELPPSAVAQIEALLAEKAARTPAQRKISSTLLYAKSGRFAAESKETKDPSKQITSLAQRDARGRVLVDIKGDVDASAVSALDGEVVGSSRLHHSTRAWMPLERLEELAAGSNVQAIRPALQAAMSRHDAPRGGEKFRTGTHAERVAAMQRAREAWRGPSSQLAPQPAPEQGLAGFASPGARLSEGVKAHGVTRARKLYNVGGSGVRVGVLSDSDDGSEQSIASGDLPASTITIPGQDGRPGSGEGTAMMEIVHDVAPDAQIVFATAFISPESFADNIRRLRFDYGCDVIVDDIIYFFESPYQDDIIAQAVEDVVADGAVYVSSAGNQGNADDGTSGTWEGDFRAAGTLSTLPAGYTVHDFGNRVISNRIELGGGPLILHWSDPGTLEAPASFNDYDLFVLDNSLREVAVASTDLQDGAGLPFEYLGYNIPAGFRVVVAAAPNAEVRAIRLAHFGGELGIATGGSSYGHNSAANALGAAAVDVVEAGEGEFAAGALTPVELYSADGPRRVFYDRTGNPYTPGKVTFGTAGGQLRNKPDITGADGVQTTLPPGSGLNPFFGTSAAAPHVAGIAALIKSALPSATSLQIRNAIKNGALDIEAAGMDRNAGLGIAFAPEALKRAGAAFAAYIELNSLTLVPTGSDVVLPGGGAQLRVQLRNNGGANATAVSATLSSSSPYVTITSASSTYPTVYAGATATNPTQYAFTVSASAPCGVKLPFTLTVNYTGNGTHPAVVPFSIQTGRPSPTPTRIAYTGPSVAIPDADLDGVDIPFTVAGAGPLASLTFRLDGSMCNTTAGSTTVGLAHTWAGDVALKLTSPGGTRVTLLDAAGGPFNSGNNFCQTALDDTAATSIQAVTAAQAPFTGTFTPLSPLSAFIGENGDGTWTLNASDSTFLDTGTVHAFSIETRGFTCTP